TTGVDRSDERERKKGGMTMRGLNSACGAALLALALASGANAQDKPLNIAFTIHSSPSNTFWQAVKKGFDDACGKIQANCQMIFTQTEGSIAEQQSNMQTALAASPDALITSIVDNSAFDELIKNAS